MATFTHSPNEVSATWTHSPNEVSATFTQTSGETAASWYSLGLASYGFLHWENFDDVNWDDISLSSEYLENWEDMG